MRLAPNGLASFLFSPAGEHLWRLRNSFLVRADVQQANTCGSPSPRRGDGLQNH